jgi:hypothetical protein
MVRKCRNCVWWAECSDAGETICAAFVPDLSAHYPTK